MASDLAGRSVSSAGDVNGDGIDDLIESAPFIGRQAGEAYVIYGALPTVAVARIGTATTQTIHGGAFNDTLTGLAGNDTLIGNNGAARFNG